MPCLCDQHYHTKFHPQLIFIYKPWLFNHFYSQGISQIQWWLGFSVFYCHNLEHVLRKFKCNLLSAEPLVHCSKCLQLKNITKEQWSMRCNYVHELGASRCNRIPPLECNRERAIIYYKITKHQFARDRDNENCQLASMGPGFFGYHSTILCSNPEAKGSGTH